MCGIAGSILGRPLVDEDIARGERFLIALRHRGPDDSGAAIDRDRGVFLGHTRLTILDPTDRNAQPMGAKGAVLTYNGELYNYLELRRILESLGHRFRTTGDTEVLLAAWVEWGPSALERLDGMFAFAVLDGERLHLVRDPFGEKPLYWARTPEGVHFSSEPGPLVDELGLTFAPTTVEVAQFLALGFLPEPGTGYPGLHAVPPATHLVLGSDGVRATTRYWQPPTPYEGSGRIEPVRRHELDALRDALARSLERRLHADVPLGLFLSGGVDSTLVAALLARELGRDVGAFTVAFSDGVDESIRATAIAEELGLDHTIIDSLADTTWQKGPESLRELYGVPNDNYSAFAMRQLASAARPHIKVALTGTGGDELFYGYARTRFLHHRRHAYRWLGGLMDLVGPVGDRLLPRWERWSIARDRLTGGPDHQYLAAKARDAMPLLRELDGLDDAVRGLTRTIDGSLAVRGRDADLRVVLPGSYLSAMDRASMSVGLELRTPYLSRELVEVVSAIDQRSMLYGGHKSAARRILAGYLPAGLVDPGKQGFVLPLERFLSACPPVPPSPPPAGLPRAVIESIWDRRGERQIGDLLVRVAVLEAFESADAQPRALDDVASRS